MPTEEGWRASMNAQMRQERMMETSMQSSARLKSTLREAEKARAMGADTMASLQNQSETLGRVNDKLDETADYLTFTERTVRGMDSIVGSFKNWMTSGSYKAPKIEETKTSQSLGNTVSGWFGMGGGSKKKDNEDTRQGSSSGLGAEDEEDDVKPSSGVGGKNRAAAERVDWSQESKQGIQATPHGRTPNKSTRTVDYRERLQAVEEQQDRDIDSLGSIVGDLKNMSHMMNHELNKQSTMIDGISTKVDTTHDRIKKSNKKIKGML